VACESKCGKGGEILLKNNGMCNLTTVNVMAFVNVDGSLDKELLYEAFRLSARAGYRMATVELELEEWDKVQQEDRLIGASFTGWQDMINATNMTKEEENKLWAELRECTHQAADDLANKLGLNKSKLYTAIKPEGTLSQLPVVSSGIHYSHSPYYIRRIRITSSDPLVKVCEELGYPIFPEVGQEMTTAKVKVIEFPVRAPVGRTKYDVSAIEQLENYKRSMEFYTDHNTSITVSVKDEEWDGVEQWVWENWDDILGISFLSLSDSFYQLLPYEAITKEEYDKRVIAMKPFNPELLKKYEMQQTEEDLGTDPECSSGACGVR